ncbi:hypothetical protein [Bacillus sp. FJAT-45350]|nr:hypothetical protein [Bacillus sp. FJAT-45350]
MDKKNVPQSATFIGKSRREFFGESLTDRKAEEVLKMIKTKPKKEK